mgnify:CR=1 FL=1
MIREMPLRFSDLDVTDPGVGHHGLCGFAASDLAAGKDFGILAIGAGNANLRVKRKDEHQQEQDHEDTLRDENEGEGWSHGDQKS